jgi:hypothetical protein
MKAAVSQRQCKSAVTMSDSERFVYYGNASILSGHLHQQRDVELDLGGSALPLGGGQSCHRLTDQSFGDVISFVSAETHAHGAAHDHAESDADASATTPPAQAVVGVDFRGLLLATRPALRVKRIAAALTAHCDCDSAEPSMGTLDDARYEGVAVDDYRLSVSINRAFFNAHDTLSKLAAAPARARPRAAGRGPVLAPPDNGSARPMLTTIVKSLRWLKEPFPGATIDGHVLSIPGLGRIFFGEMLVSGPTRRLTMLRFELTGDVVFDGACCEVETGGNWRR